MNPLLLTLAIALILIAAAIAMWSQAGARQLRLQHEHNLRKHLDGENHTPSAQTEPGALPGPHKPHPLDNLLIRAGMTPGWGIPIMLCVTVLVIAALATWRMQNILGGAMASIVVLVLMTFWISLRIQRQRRKLVADLPDFLENIVRLITIGQSLQMAFQNAATRTTGPLREVLDRALRRMRAGVDLEDALHQAGQGFRIQELDLLESILRMSTRYGGRTDLILQRMSDFMRDLSQAQQDLRSITSETRTASWVLGALPVVTGGVMMLVNPEFFTPMLSTSLGHRLLLVALCLELFGAFLLYRLTKSL